LGLCCVAPHAGFSVGRRASCRQPTVSRPGLPRLMHSPSSSLGSNNRSRSCAVTHRIWSPMSRSTEERRLPGLHPADTVRFRSAIRDTGQFAGARAIDVTTSSCCSNLRIQSAVTA